jgi:hypothetical protein
VVNAVHLTGAVGVSENTITELYSQSLAEANSPFCPFHAAPKQKRMDRTYIPLRQIFEKQMGYSVSH